jgi:hypothetical protein
LGALACALLGRLICGVKATKIWENYLPTKYVLIDFENLQPKYLENLAEHPLKVIAFIVANQTKVPFNLATIMRVLGENAKYGKI